MYQLLCVVRYVEVKVKVKWSLLYTSGTGDYDEHFN